jgi:hypothetical protein
MNNYLDKLNQIEKQIKEEAHAENESISESSRNSSRSSNSNSVRTDASSTSNSSGSWSSNLLRGRISEKRRILIRDERREKLMVPSKGLFDDYNAIDKEDISVAEKVWKYIPKLLKVILNTRTNTVKIMDKLGIPRETDDKVKVQEVGKPNVIKTE